MQTSATPSLAPGFDLSCWRSWARRILVGNPFYLFSAACLLYGIYQVSLDSHFAGREFSQLVFNFSALQIYEALLTATAIFLARRRIWYDATLLVVLEAAFILLPFILISQAVYLDKSMAFTILGATLLLAGMKFSGLKRLFPGLNLPPQLLAIGAVIAGANGLLPLMFNAILDSDNALLINNIQEAEIRLVLIGVFPVLASLPNLLPSRSAVGDLASQKRGLPLLMALVWVAATAVHIYSIRYVYKSSVEVSCFTPAFWVLAWTLFNRRTDFRLEIHLLAQSTLLFMPFLLALPGFLPPTAHLNFMLLSGNATAYFGLYLMKRKDVFRMNMVVLSMTALTVEILRELARRTSWDFSEIPRLIPYGAAYLILAGVAFRSAKIGLPAAIAAGCVAAICNRTDDAGHIGLQICLGFLLLHSLGWRDQSELGAGTARKLVASIWVLHSFIWVGGHTRASIALPASIAGAVMSGYFFFVWVLGQPMRKVLLWSSSATVCSAPARYVAQGATMISMGIILVAVSFGLFALGTYFALRREKCLAFIQPQPPSQPENEPPCE